MNFNSAIKRIFKYSQKIREKFFNKCKFNYKWLCWARYRHNKLIGGNIEIRVKKEGNNWGNSYFYINWYVLGGIEFDSVGIIGNLWFYREKDKRINY